MEKFIKENKERFLGELFDFLRIPSISADPTHDQDVKDAAEFVKKSLLDAGVDHAEICPTPGHPIVYAEKLVHEDLPTVLVYGHYDVQPPDPLDLWETPPFDPKIRFTDIHPEGAIFARGACDDKGQVYMYVKALETMLALDRSLPCNIKFLIEGEEEVGSVNLKQFCIENVEKLSCDTILLSDTSIIANDIPSITIGLRGLTYMEVEVTGANRDLHSGVYGGAVANPINVLCEMIASLRDENYHITIPGFYEGVPKLNENQRTSLNAVPFNLESYKKDLEIEEVMGEAGYTTVERTAIRPTLDVNGIWGGYTGEGAKTVLPSKAYAKISMRLVGEQDPDVVAQLFADHFVSTAPKGVHVRVTALHGGRPAMTSTHTDEYAAAELAMEHSFGKRPIPQICGGSIPIVADFKEVLGVNSVLMGFGLDSDGLHSPNEHFGVFNFLKGIETIPLFFEKYAQLKRR